MYLAWNETYFGLNDCVFPPKNPFFQTVSSFSCSRYCGSTWRWSHETWLCSSDDTVPEYPWQDLCIKKETSVFFPVRTEVSGSHHHARMAPWWSESASASRMLSSKYPCSNHPINGNLSLVAQGKTEHRETPWPKIPPQVISQKCCFKSSITQKVISHSHSQYN